jgi:hypothetical protein
MELSESFWLSAGGMGLGFAVICLWYFKSTLMTSRCTEVACCCLKIKNQPVSEQTLEEIIVRDQPPTFPSTQGRATQNGQSGFRPISN